MSLSINGTNGLVFNDGSSQNTSPFTGGLGFRNRIINGDCRIDQRNAGASVTYTNTVGYGIDRFRNVALGTSLGFSVARSTTAPAGFTNSLIATVTSAKSPASTDQARINQYIEGFNVADLGFGTSSASPITLSFWVRSSITGTYCVSISNADSATRSYVATYTINAANTWEQKAITITGDTTGTWTTSNSIGMGVSFSLGCGSSFNASTANTWNGAEYNQTAAQTNWISNSGATFYITGVQLEKGSTATSFDYRPYGTELALCQRYCLTYRPAQADSSIAIGSWRSSTQAFIHVVYPVEMRTTPSLTYSALSDWGASLLGYHGGGQNGFTSSLSIATESNTKIGYLAGVYSSAQSTGGNYTVTALSSTTSTSTLTLSAEL